MQQRTFLRLGDLWARESENKELKPHVLIGLWNEPNMAVLDIEQLKQLRKFITTAIINATYNKQHE